MPSTAPTPALPTPLSAPAPAPAPAFVSRPALALGPHTVTAERIREDILDRNPDYPARQAQTVRLALGNLPGTRRYFRPYELVSSPGAPPPNARPRPSATCWPPPNTPPPRRC